MLAETQTRLDHLDARLPDFASRDNTDTLGAEDEYAEAQARAALHNLLFPDLPMEVPFFVDQYGNPHTSHHMGSSRNPFDQKPTVGIVGTANTSRDGGFETLFTDVQGTERTVRPSGEEADRELPEWGSEVDIPDGESSVPPPKFAPALPPKGVPGMPTIHVQPPTTTTTHSNGEAQRAQTLISAGPYDEPLELHDVTANSQPSTHRIKSTSGAPPQPDFGTGQPSAYHTPAQTRQDPLISPAFQASPWDIVTQRLLSWALVWPAEDFIRSLEAIALGRQVIASPRQIICSTPCQLTPCLHRISRWMSLL